MGLMRFLVHFANRSSASGNILLPDSWYTHAKVSLGHKICVKEQGHGVGSPSVLLPNARLLWLCTNVHSHQPNMKAQAVLHPRQRSVLSDFGICASLMCMNWYIIRILIWASLNIKEPEHLFICLSVIHTLILNSCLFGYFSSGFFFFFLVLLKYNTFKKNPYIPDTNTLFLHVMNALLLSL